MKWTPHAGRDGPAPVWWTGEVLESGYLI